MRPAFHTRGRGHNSRDFPVRLAGSRSHIGPFAGTGLLPNLEQFARTWIDKPFAGERPVHARRRRVQRLALVAAAPEKVPDQNKRGGDNDPEEQGEAAGHVARSITAAVP